MATLTANISATATTIPVSGEVDIGHYTIDSEAIRVLGSSRGPTGRAQRLFASVDRGIAGTTAATHLSGATLTRYYPDAATGEGGLTNPLLEPFEITPTATDASALIVTMPTGGTEAGVAIHMDVDEDRQAFVIKAGAGAGTNVVEFYRGSANFVSNETTVDSLTITPLAAPDGSILWIMSDDGPGWVRVNTSGHFAIGGGGPPADASLFSGEMALWFDATNGAPKLRAKGKSANGTVVTFTLDPDA